MKAGNGNKYITRRICRKIAILSILASAMIPPGCGSDDYWNRLNTSTSTLSALPSGIFVNQLTGSDTAGDGTPERPYASIQKGLQDAQTRGLSAVHVAAGVYALTASLVLMDGISLYGGYNANDWRDRDNSRTNPQYNTEIRAPAAGNIAISGTTAISTATVIDGFIIQGGSINTGTNIGINLSAGASPTISNNTIIGGSASSTDSIAINILNSSPSIISNTIQGGTSSDSAIGIWMSGSSAYIAGNVIQGALSVTIDAYGIYIMAGSTPFISYNSSIYGGDGSNSSTGIFVSNCNAAGITIQYNTIATGNTPHAYGIRIMSSTGSMTLLRNSINAANSTNEAFGIYSDSSDPEIAANSINSGGGQYTYGVYYIALPGKIFNNTIYGGSGTTNVYGILLSSSSSEIYNNTIDGGGSGTSATSAIILFGSAPYINNNIIFTTAGVSRYGINEGDAGSDPMEVLNNDIFNCTTALYRDENSLDRNVIALVNSDVLTTQRGAATAAGNVDIDVTAFFVADYLITSAIPGVTDGGLDGFGAGWGFTDDKDGNPRIVPWSMGAYQY